MSINRRKTFLNIFICCLLIFICTVTLTVSSFADDVTVNLVRDGSFENDTGEWNIYVWNEDVSEIRVDKSVAKDGQSSMYICNNSDNDARIYQYVSVKPSTYYTVKAYIKTEGIKEAPAGEIKRGATISVMNTLVVSDSVIGTTNWREVEFSFYTANDMDYIELCFTVGGYGAENSGEAWFDDIRMEEVSQRPSRCHSLPSLKGSNNTNTNNHWAGATLQKNPDKIKWMAFAFAWFIILYILTIAFAESNPIKVNDKKIKHIFITVLAFASIFRVAVAILSPGFTYDIGTFEAWSWHASTGLFDMYTPGKLNFLDYPPVYMYILAPIGVLVSFARGILKSSALAVFFLKLPSMAADIIAAVVLYRFAKKRLDSKWAVILSVSYVLNPAIWINSSGWGQVDSLFTMLLMIELIYILDKKWIGAGIMFALMVLMKPHGIIFTPVIGMVVLLELVRNKDIKPMFKVICGFLAMAAVILLPFYIKMGFKNPKWIIELYFGTLDNYAYATFNGFNFWAMLGKNLTPVTDKLFGLTYTQLGMIGIAVSCIVMVIISVFSSRKKSVIKHAMPAIISLFILVSVFTFAHKMHERYMFMAIMLSVMAFIMTKDKGYLHLSALFSFVIFANTYMIYNYNVMYIYPHPSASNKTVMFLGAIEVVSFIWLLILTIKNTFLNMVSKPISLLDENESVNESKHILEKYGNVNDCVYEETVKKPTENSYYKMKMSKRDWITVSIMMVIYSIVAFVNLGSFVTPQTYWRTELLTDYFVVDLGEEVEVTRINFYQGDYPNPNSVGAINALFSVDDTAKKFSQIYNIEEKSDGTLEKKRFSELCKGVFKLCSVDCKTFTNEPIKTRYIKFMTSKKYIAIGEIAIYVNGSKTPWEHIEIVDKNTTADNSNLDVLFDEQDKIPYSYDVMNSTYFDEIYHGRTGYEHLVGMSPEEKSHPPLGKLFIALGMAIFGKNMFGMRAMGTIFGVFMILLMYMFGKKLTKTSFGGFAAAFLMMFDFMHYTHSRIASIDVYTVTFVILMFYFMYDYYVYKSYNMGIKKTYLSLFLSGFFMACAISVKWNGAYGALGLAVIFFIGLFEQIRDYKTCCRLPDKPNWTRRFINDYVWKLGILCVFSFIIVPAIIYFSTFIPLMNVTDGTPYTFKGILDLQEYMKWFHTEGVAGRTHPYMSSWYTWPIIGKPIVMYVSADNVAGWGVIATMGNPAVWWGGIAGVISAAIIAIKNRDRRLLPIFVAILSLLLPWVLVKRSTYIYHYFPILPFVILCTAFSLDYLRKNVKWGKKAVYGYFTVAVILFILFFPVLTGIKFNSQETFNIYYKMTRWFASWKF